MRFVVIYDTIQHLVLKLEIRLLSNSTIDASNVTFAAHVLLDLCQVLVGNLDVSHLDTVSLCQSQGMSSIFS